MKTLKENLYLLAMGLGILLAIALSSYSLWAAIAAIIVIASIAYPNDEVLREENRQWLAEHWDEANQQYEL